MASLALPWYRIRVIVTSTQESRGVEMAGIALCIGHDVCVGLWSGNDAFAIGMTAIAGARCAFEHAADVAGFTSCNSVTAG
jgi:hypothetical protein